MAIATPHARARLGAHVLTTIPLLEVRTHASTRADRFASEAEARESLGADLWITRSMAACRSVGAVMLTSLELGEIVTDRV